MIKTRLAAIASVILAFIMVAKFLQETVFYKPLGVNSGNGNVHTVTNPSLANTSGPGWSKFILEKDLFSRMRGYVPPPPPAAAKKIQPPERPDFSLKGVILVNGIEEAIIEDGRGGEKTLSVGDTVSGATLVKISNRKAIFKWMDQEINLHMKFKSANGHKRSQGIPQKKAGNFR